MTTLTEERLKELCSQAAGMEVVYAADGKGQEAVQVWPSAVNTTRYLGVPAAEVMSMTQELLRLREQVRKLRNDWGLLDL